MLTSIENICKEQQDLEQYFFKQFPCTYVLF